MGALAAAQKEAANSDLGHAAEAPRAVVSREKGKWVGAAPGAALPVAALRAKAAPEAAGLGLVQQEAVLQEA